MTLGEYLDWEGRAVWIAQPGAGEPRRRGVVASIDLTSTVGGTRFVSIRLDDGTIVSVSARQRGSVWDFADG